MSDHPEVPEDWCAWHGVVEPYHPEKGDYCCPECWHTFKRFELMDQHNQIAGEGNQVEADEDVRICPFCFHDL